MDFSLMQDVSEPVEKAMRHENKLGAGAEKRKHLSPEHKKEAVMAEFHRGTLHSGSGHIVKSKAQAAAIAYSESRKKEKDSSMGEVMHEFKQGTLHSSSGEKVTSKRQAIAIGMSYHRG
jgi:hypothetical protein